MKHTPEHIEARSLSKRLKAQERRNLPSNGTTWREQHAAGKCLRDAAGAMGKTVWQGRRWAEAEGLKWPDGRHQKSHRLALSRVRKKRFREDEEFRTRELERMDKIRPHLSPAHNRRLHMSADERDLYDLLVSKKYTADEAAFAIGRPDLGDRAMIARRAARDPDRVLRQLMAKDAAAYQARAKPLEDNQRGRTKGGRT